MCSFALTGIIINVWLLCFGVFYMERISGCRA